MLAGRDTSHPPLPIASRSLRVTRTPRASSTPVLHRVRRGPNARRRSRVETREITFPHGKTDGKDTVVPSLSDLPRFLGQASLNGIFATLLLFELFALASVPSVLLRRRGRPTAALAWLLALFALPAVGGFAWWAFGRTRVERRRRKSARKHQEFSRQRTGPRGQRETVFDGLLPARADGEWVFSSRSNDVVLLADGPRFFPEFERSLEEAKSSIQIMFYILEHDSTGLRLLELLRRKAEQGVVVRLLVDGFGSQQALSALKKNLRGSKICFAVFLPSRLSPLYAPRINFTNHRKVVVIDNRVAFTGGMNVGLHYEHHWRDLMLRIEGPAVLALEHIFLEDWYFATNVAVDDTPPAKNLYKQDGVEVATVSSGPDSEPWIFDAYFLAITRAESRIWIATPYFIPHSSITTALRTAAGRGVDVRIVVPTQSDVRIVQWASRSYYRDLIDAGVRIFEYRGPMLHAKALVWDNEFSSVGTANIDSRSMRLSFEVACFVRSETLNHDLAEWVGALFLDSDEISTETLNRKTLPQKLAESVAHLLSPVL